MKKLFFKDDTLNKVGSPEGIKITGTSKLMVYVSKF